MNATSQGQAASSAIQGLAAAAVLAGLLWRVLDGWRDYAWLAQPVLLVFIMPALLWRIAQGPATSRAVFAAGLGLLVMFAAGTAAAVSRATGRLVPEVVSVVLSTASLLICVILYIPTLRNVATALHKIIVACGLLVVLTSLCLSATVLAGYASPGLGLPPRVAVIRAGITPATPAPPVVEADPQTITVHGDDLADVGLTADDYCEMNVTARVAEYVPTEFVGDAVGAITLHGATWAGCPLNDPLLVDTTLVWRLSHPSSATPAGVLLVGPECAAVVVEAELANSVTLQPSSPCALPWHSDGLHRVQSVASADSCVTYLGAATAGSPYAALPAPVAWLVAQAAQALDRSPFVVGQDGTTYTVGFRARDGSATSVVVVEFDPVKQHAVATSGISRGLTDGRTACAPGIAVLGG